MEPEVDSLKSAANVTAPSLYCLGLTLAVEEV